MEPINYLPAQQNSPLQSLASGLQVGAGFQQLQQQQLEMEKAQAAAQRTAQFRAEVGPALQAGDPAALVQLFVKYPDFGDQIKQASGFLNDADENNKKTTSATVYNGLQSGNVDIAKQALQSRVNYLTKIGGNADEWKGALDALNSGDPDKIGQVKQQATLMHALYNPTAVKAIGEIRKDEREQELQPSALRTAVAGAGKAEAEAATAAVKAKYADSQALQDLEKTGWDIKKIKADIDIARESNRIAAMNAAANREGNGLKRQELQMKIDDAKTARDEKIRGKVADVEAGAGNIDNMLNTIVRIEKNPRLNSVIGAIEGRMPAITNDESADAIALIETLGSQAFLSQIPNIKGMGALSNAEGEKLQAAFQNLSRKQSEKQFKETLAEATRLLKKGRSTLEKRYGVPLGSPDTPAAVPRPGAPAAPASPVKNITVDY
jgi:hypothetical protein